MRRRALVAAAAVLLAGCSSSGGHSGGSAPASTRRSAATTAGATSAACSRYKAGSTGVVQTFCAGPGSATIVDAGASYSVPGGSCAGAGDQLTFNAGVVTSGLFQGARPDYVGLVAATGDEPAVVALVYGGSAHPLGRPVVGVSADRRSGTFAGTSAQGARVTGSFACGT